MYYRRRLGEIMENKRCQRRCPTPAAEADADDDAATEADTSFGTQKADACYRSVVSVPLCLLLCVSFVVCFAVFRCASFCWSTSPGDSSYLYTPGGNGRVECGRESYRWEERGAGTKDKQIDRETDK